MKQERVLTLDTGRLLVANNPFGHAPFASSTKVVTAILTCRYVSDFSEMVTAEQGDFAQAGGSGLQDGYSLTIEDTFYEMMLSSSNPAASLLARLVGSKILAAEGSAGDPRDRFILAMNNLATELGLRSTVFVTPNGAGGDRTSP